MTDQTNSEVDKERIVVPPSDETEEDEGSEIVESDKEKSEEESSSSIDKKPDEEDGTESESEEKPEEKSEEDSKKETDTEKDGDQTLVDQTEGQSLKRQPGETDREFALRLELDRVKESRRKERAGQLLGDIKPDLKKSEGDLTDDDKALLKQYDQGELGNFEKILDVLAKKRGWVRKDEFRASTYQQLATDNLESFLADHKEYLPENDPGNVLWNRFRTEFALYRQPENPKDLKKIFNKIHKEVFGIQPESDLKTINAQKEKLNVASHSGASSNKTVRTPTPSNIDSNLRSHLKGFSDKELDEMFGQ
jgi:hypothetical protein